jgi:translation elongation factor EF-1alpha
MPSFLKALRKKLVKKTKPNRFKALFVFDSNSIVLFVSGIVESGELKEGMKTMIQGIKAEIVQIRFEKEVVKSAFEGQEIILELKSTAPLKIREGQVLEFF